MTVLLLLFLRMPVKRDLMKMGFYYAQWINCDCQAMTQSRWYYYSTTVYSLKAKNRDKASHDNDAPADKPGEIPPADWIHPAVCPSGRIARLVWVRFVPHRKWRREIADSQHRRQRRCRRDERPHLWGWGSYARRAPLSSISCKKYLWNGKVSRLS